MYHNFVKVAAAIPVSTVGNCMENARRGIELIGEADKQGVEIVCFPELYLSSCTSGDLLLNSDLRNQTQEALSFILNQTADCPILVIMGMPVEKDNCLYNCAVVFQKGKLLGIVPKQHLPSYQHRYFSSGINTESAQIALCGITSMFSIDMLFSCGAFTFSVELGEDLWSVVPPSSGQALAGSHILFNLSASNEEAGKNDYRKQLVMLQSARCNAGYVYVSSGFGESSSDMLFASSAIIAENGLLLAESERFTTDSSLIISEIDIELLKNERFKNCSFKQMSQYRKSYYFSKFNIIYDKPVDLIRKVLPNPFIPQHELLDKQCSDIFNIQINSLVTRLFNTEINKVVIGISGGLDSTLALMVTVGAFDRLKIPSHNIIGITMPGFGTTQRTKQNSLLLMDALKITSKEIPIDKAVLQHFKDIDHSVDQHDITYENAQARERTQILMDIANKENALVVGTGDMSELALGWCTYGGDQMSMYGVNSGIPKTLVKHLIKWIASNKVNINIAQILIDILDTPISPELLPHKNNQIDQKTEDVIGPYVLHDFFMFYFLRFGFSTDKILFLAQHAFKDIYPQEFVEKWLKVFIKRFFSQQFKRSAMPEGVKVGSISLSPRIGFNIPGDICSKGFL